MRHRSKLWAAILAILIGAAPCLASTIPTEEVRVTATCEGYTITAVALFLEPGEVLDFDYQITLDALSEGSDAVIVGGTLTFDATGCVPDPGRTSCDLTLIQSFTWVEALGGPLPPGDYELNTNATGGSCEGKPSRYSWTSPFTGDFICERLLPDDSWDGFLSCPLLACDCLFIIDEDSVDNDVKTIEAAADAHFVEPDVLVNDDSPTEIGNPWLRWNLWFPGDVVDLPTGEVKDEGWFALPQRTPWPLEDFVAGLVPQNRLDKIDGVMPIRSQEIAKMVGRTCTAIVYDSDISINYKPINGNLQGERYGRFRFTILDAIAPGTLDESGSSTSLYDVRIRVEDNADRCIESLVVPRRDEDPDDVQTERASYKKKKGKLIVWAKSSEQPHAKLNISVAGAEGEDEVVFEAPMTWNKKKKRYEFVLTTSENLTGRQVHISSDLGGSYNDEVE